MLICAPPKKQKKKGKMLLLVVKRAPLAQCSDSLDVITLVTYGVIKPRNLHITPSTSGRYTFAARQSRGKIIFCAILVECIVSMTATEKPSSALTREGPLGQPSFQNCSRFTAVSFFFLYLCRCFSVTANLKQYLRQPKSDRICSPLCFFSFFTVAYTVTATKH